MWPNRDYTNCACDPLSLKRYVNCTSQQIKAKTCDKADDILEANKTSIVPGFLAADAALNTAAIAEMAQLNKPRPVPIAVISQSQKFIGCCSVCMKFILRSQIFMILFTLFKLYIFPIPCCATLCLSVNMATFGGWDEEQ
uniref:Uncharacterized protein n=1 Tax=Glossina palpalis gambiensis TaxID=67801 RepID=A0A1B0BEG1_9MUSC